MNVLGAMVGVVVLALVGLSGCELESPDPCGDAKEHLCSKIQGQNCNTSTMDDAVNSISTECGKSTAVAFSAAASAYCATTESFSVSECSGL